MMKFLPILALVATTCSACPYIVSRTEWGARPSEWVEYMGSPVPYVVIHHAVSNSCYNQADCSAQVRSFQNYHMDSNGWGDIGYSFLVGEDGNAYEGRGWNQVGAHAPGYNYNSIGICFIGTFTSAIPNDAAQNACRALIQCGIDLGKITSGYSLIGHRQASATECPGTALYNLITGWDHWTPNP